MKGLENGVARIEPNVYKGILLRLVKTYQYFNQNKKPDKVIIPRLLEIDGVPVEMEPEEVEHAVVSRKPKSTKLNVVNTDGDIGNDKEADE